MRLYTSVFKTPIGKFLAKGLLLVTMVIIFVVMSNAIYVRMDKNDDNHIPKFNMIPQNIQISNIGSSHGLWDFCYDELEKNYTCFNFALNSQTLSYDYRILSEYENKLADGGIMFVPISYFLFYGHSETEDDGFESKNQRYYKILSPKNIKEYELKDDILFHYFPILSAQGEILTVFLGRSIDTNEEIWHKVASDIDIEADALAAHTRHFSNDEYGENINWDEIGALYRIIDLCKAKQITPILVTTPYLAEYTNLVYPEFFENFNNLIHKIQNDTGVAYYDYAKDERFQSDYSLFLNSDHLNKSGALKFVSILRDEVISTIGANLKANFNNYISPW